MSQERVGITVEVKGGEEALNLMRQLDDAIKKLNGTKIKINFGGQELNGLVSANQKVTQLGDGMVNAQARTKTLGDAMRTTFNRISSTTMHVGQQMQVLGKTLTQISSPMRTLFRSTVWAGGFKMLNQVTEGMSKGFTRYDTMKKYPKIMAAFGYSNEDAKASIDRLDKSVRGLPTGLDEMVDMSQRFTATTGNIKKGTDLAIAANNAFLASMSTDTQKYQGMMQLQDVLGGKDMNAREWNSLVSSMTPAIVKMGESLGYTKDNMDEWITAVRSGEVANEDFIETLIKVGTEGGSVAKMAENSKDTWQAFFANVGNASSRMMAAVIESFDEVSKVMSGKDLNLFLSENVIGYIDQLKEAVTGWIRANPDYFINFLDSLKKFDWGGLVRGVGEGLKQTMDDIKQFAEFFGNRGISGEAMGRFFARAPLYGKILNVTGGFLKGMRGIIAAITTGFAIPSLMKKTGTGGGLFGMLGKVLGKPEDAEEVATTARIFPTFKESLQGLVSGLAGALKVFGTLAIGAGTGFVVFKSFKSMFADMKSMVDIAKSIDWDIAKEIGTGMAVFLGSFATMGAVLGGTELGGVLLAGEAILGAITTLASGIFALDMHLLKKGFANFKKITDYLKEGMDNLSQVTSHSVPTQTIGRAIETFNEVYNMLKPKYQGQGIQNMRTGVAKRMKNNVKAMSDVIKGIVDFQKTSKEMQGIGEIPASTVTKVQRLFERLGEIHEAISQSFATKASVSQAKDAKNILTNTKKMFETLTGENGVLAQIGKVGEEIPKITEGAANKLKLGKKTVEVQKLKSPLEQAREGMTTLFEEIGNMFEGFAGKVGFSAETNSTLASRIVDNVKTMFDNIVGDKGLIAQIGSIAPKLKTITNATSLNGLSPMQDAEIYMGSLFQFLGNIYKKLTDSKEGLGMYQNVTEGSSDTANTILGNVQSMFNTLLGEEGIIAQISNMLPKIQPLFKTSGEDLSPLQNVELYVGQLFDSIRKIYDSFNGEDGKGLGGADMTAMSESITLLPQIMTNIQDAVNTISGMGKKMSGLAGEDGSFPIIGQIKDMISQLSQAFSAESIGALQAQVEGFKQTISNLLDSISDMTGMSEGNPLEVAITITHTISETVTGALEQAKSDIDAAWSAIPTSLDREITINISYRKNVQPFPSLGVPGVSTGGYIAGDGKVLYRAGGGNIPMFKPRGTDTVPAMLTPGEYVTRKRAVDFFGIDFMQKINHLDVRGAIESLMARASGMSGIGRQTVINNTYNNNQKVVQNINTNSPDFAFKSASRFAGAF